MKVIPLFSAFTALALTSLSRADYFPECEGFEPGSFLASSTDCNKFIYCDDDDSQEGACPEQLHFDPIEGTCTSPEEANCRIGEEETEPPEETTQSTTTTQRTTTTTTTATTEATTTTTTPDTTVSSTAASTQSVATVTPEPDSTVATDSGSLVTVPGVTHVRDKCPAIYDPNEVVVIASSKSCSAYYLCHYDQAIELRCSSHLHFNPNTGRCDFPENVGCALDRPGADQCRPGMTEFFPHATNCNYFYYCVKGFLTLQQCPFFYGWDVERRSCVLMSQAKCFS